MSRGRATRRCSGPPPRPPLVCGGRGAWTSPRRAHFGEDGAPGGKVPVTPFRRCASEEADRGVEGGWVGQHGLAVSSLYVEVVGPVCAAVGARAEEGPTFDSSDGQLSVQDGRTIPGVDGRLYYSDMKSVARRVLIHVAGKVPPIRRPESRTRIGTGPGSVRSRAVRVVRVRLSRCIGVHAAGLSGRRRSVEYRLSHPSGSRR